MPAKTPTWSQLKAKLAGLDKPELLDLIKDIFDLSTANRSFLAARFLGGEGAAPPLEEYRKRITDQFYPKRGFGRLKLGEARGDSRVPQGEPRPGRRPRSDADLRRARHQLHPGLRRH